MVCPKIFKKICNRIACANCMRNNRFVIIMISFVALGVILGVALRYRPESWTQKEISYLRFPGEMYMRMLRLISLPLIISSMLVAIASLDIKASGVIGIRTTVYFLATMSSSVLLGIIIVSVIAPGYHGSDQHLHGTAKQLSTSPADLFLDLFRNAIPDNIFAATFQKTVTVYKQVPAKVPKSNLTTNEGLVSDESSTVAPVAMDIILTLSTKADSNILGIIVFTVAFACAVSIRGDKAKGVVSFFEGCNEAVQCLIQVIIWFSPIGVCFLFAAKIIEMEDPLKTLTHLGLYILTFIVGLVIHAGIVLSLVYLVVVKKNPFRHMHGAAEALIVALSTASSSATLPITMRCMEEKNAADPRVSRFLLPIGATVNMDGTAMFGAVAAIFVAQLNKIPLHAGAYVIIFVTSIASAIGAAGIPEAGLVNLAIILQAADLPVQDISLLLAIDWFLDRLRTVVNVWGDVVGAAVVEKLSKKQLRPKQKREDGDIEVGVVDDEDSVNEVDEENDQGNFDNIAFEDNNDIQSDMSSEVAV